ncbi:MAG: DUF1080 domain-containing protein [Opitutus sp.]|nr:DUF1080 domain-containing protein [Opitutus sp.]
MITLNRVSFLTFARGVACALLIATSLRAAPAGTDAFVGRWALTLPSAAGWLEVKKENGWLDGSLLWGGGSVLPVSSVTAADGTLTVTKVREVERKDAAGKVVRKQQLTDTLTVTIEGDTLKGVRLDPRPNGGGFNRTEFTGKRTPALPSRPNLAKIKFGDPVALLNGRDLSGWKVKEPDLKNAWAIEKGVLVNQPPAHAEGQPRVRTANLRTEREFEDFNLKLEVSVPAGNNSGVYLRGIYEIQVFDSYGKALDSHNMGALYSRITPSVAAEKPAGEWQTLEMTLVDRHVTVVLNGTTIIDNQPALGCTGGAMWSDQFRPGPIYLQGDHGAVSYRNLVIRPVVK